ncbi:bifunctional serine/threonine-protein kinase/ABC transporter substrate-binding protein [Streptomyces sp. NPDC020141]|uniref:bifunctional serine/threonine-protein kinase/ABC transporter substrate-binding protein n=1 Tax=Streptomyces sp. NPDC020141 TaxID=3365065 RepID=UPI00378D523B
MRPLKKGDPSSIAGYRLAGRLGAGGMGVVYLARSAGGALCALKVIRAEHAADPGFRARFRREAEIARRITGPWVVRVVDADPEAREPWLATEFVPGPSLGEAVAAHGPLPEHTVRALGARLAGTLAGAHREGLVHRDVKPGNVLLALDGPRLIDFGIARSAGATALTATDAVIGSPGYLSPEQARAAGAGAVGPPSDVFSLGCVLAFAATGRRPFGTGTAAGIVFRTVHEEPDLDGLPPGLLRTVRSALAKDPADRPTAEALEDALGAPPAGASGSPGAGWLPPGLPALIAERSARVLDLPVPEPTVVVGPAAARGKTSRRRLLALGSAAGVLTAGGAAAWLARRSPGGSGADDPARGPLPRRVIGIQADLSGPRGADGLTRERAARLAADAFNADPDSPFRLRLKVLDHRGDARRAREAAAALAADPAVLAVLDLTAAKFTRETLLRHLEQRFPLVTVSADVAGTMEPAERRAYFELRAGHKLLLASLTRYFAARRTRRVAVVDDRADPDFSWDTVMLLREAPSGIGEVAVHPLPAGRADFGSLARAALSGGTDAVIYAGSSPSRAALLARALGERGFTGPRGALDAVLEPEFLTGAGGAAEGWVFGTPYIDPARSAGARAFHSAYRERWPAPGPGRYAAETYDAVLWLARAIRELGADRTARAALLGRLRETTYEGVAKTVAFRPTTELLDESQGGLFVHRIENGRPRFLGARPAAGAKP